MVARKNHIWHLETEGLRGARSRRSSEGEHIRLIYAVKCSNLIVVRGPGLKIIDLHITEKLAALGREDQGARRRAITGNR